MSTVEYILYHQNMLAHVKSGLRCFAASQIFSPAIRRFDCRQSQTSASWRKYQPLATAPWPEGGRPVRRVDCTVQVTAGTTVSRLRMPPRSANALRLGVCGPSNRRVSPTISKTSVFRMCGTVFGLARCGSSVELYNSPRGGNSSASATPEHGKGMLAPVAGQLDLRFARGTIRGARVPGPAPPASVPTN